MNDPFSDAPGLSDAIIDAMEVCTSREEKYFERVINFHGNFLNGGLNQALFNMRNELDAVAHAYRELSMGCIATIIETATNKTVTGDSWETVFEQPANRFDEAYTAICFNLPYASNGNQDDPEFPDTHIESDWVDRMALKYARTHREQFGAMLASIKK